MNMSAGIIIPGVALLMSVISILAYKLVTDQKKMKSIQEQQKQIRVDMKKYKDNPEKVMRLQKTAMQLSMEIMPQTFKSMMVTIIPMLLIFNWLGSTFAYEAINPGEVFSVTVEFEKSAFGDIELFSSKGVENLSPGLQQITGNAVTWELKGDEGQHNLEYKYGEETYKQEVVISEGKDYINPKLEKVRKIFFLVPIGDGIPEESNIKSITTELQPVKPLGSFSIFGWKPGWLGVYIISSFIFSMLLRKVFKVY